MLRSALSHLKSETKSSIWAIDNALRWRPRGADAFGAPSKKNATGTCRIWAICCNRPAPMRLVPFSYFCTCWKVRPSLSASFCWGVATSSRPPGFHPAGAGWQPSLSCPRPWADSAVAVGRRFPIGERRLAVRRVGRNCVQAIPPLRQGQPIPAQLAPGFEGRIGRQRAAPPTFIRSHVTPICRHWSPQ